MDKPQSNYIHNSHRTEYLAHSQHFVIPWCPSWSLLSILARREAGISTREPLIRRPFFDCQFCRYRVVWLYWLWRVVLFWPSRLAVFHYLLQNLIFFLMFAYLFQPYFGGWEALEHRVHVSLNFFTQTSNSVCTDGILDQIHRIAIMKYSKTSKQRTHWGRASCPL